MRTLKNQFIQKINLTKACFFMLAILAMTFTSCEKDVLELEKTTEETIEESATAQMRMAQTQKENITLPETAEKTVEIENMKIEDESKSRVLLYSTTTSVSHGAVREWYYSRPHFDDPLQYKFEVVITPISGDPDLYLAGYNAGAKRTIRSSTNGLGNVDTETMRITDLHSYETRAYIRVHGYTASQFRMDIYRTSVGCVEHPAADQITILLWSPVCGCDGVEYANYQAATVSGITSYTNGPCSCVITEDDFQGFSPFSRIADQSSNWRTWNAGYDGTYQDAYVHQTGWNKMLKVVDENPSGAGYHDVVRKFGYNTTGAYDLSFDMWIPTGYKGYFNLQSSQTNLVGGGFWQIFFEGNGVARIIIGGTTYQSFYYTQGSWLDIDLRINLDTDQVTSKVNGGNTKTLNYTGNIHLGGINFYAVNGALFYVDNLELSDAYCNGFAGNDEDSSLNRNDSEINLEALQNAADEKPALEFNSAAVAVPTVDTTMPSPNTER